MTVSIRLDSINLAIKQLFKEMKGFGVRQRKMERDLKMVTNYFDREYLDHEKRIERVEHHLGLPKIGAN